MSASTPSSRRSSSASANDVTDEARPARRPRPRARRSARARRDRGRSRSARRPSPSRSATSRAWPPAPKVQSTATSPGWGSVSSSSSAARTGTCSVAIASIYACPRASVRSGRRSRAGRSVVAQASRSQISSHLRAPVTTTSLRRPAQVHERRRDHDAAGGVELGLERVGGEVALEVARLARHRVDLTQRAVDVRLVVGGDPDRRGSARRSGRGPHHPESWLRNFAGTVRRFFASSVWSKVPRKAMRSAGLRPAKKELRAGVEEWEEPLHPGPRGGEANPLSPTMQLRLHIFSHFAPQTPQIGAQLPSEIPAEERVPAVGRLSADLHDRLRFADPQSRVQTG